ncbi:MAG: nucleoside 2-deoxyribosyltransferase [Pseudomonadota bacterium]
MKIYLAGPDVFAPNALEIGRAKQQLCAERGVVGLYPLDNQVDLIATEAATQIYDGNLELMERADLCIANLTPFRGPHVDDGTAFEVGWFVARGLPVWGYDNQGGGLAEKILRRGAEGLEVEDFSLAANLMLGVGIPRSGGQILSRTMDHPFSLTLFAEVLDLALGR